MTQTIIKQIWLFVYNYFSTCEQFIRHLSSKLHRRGTFSRSLWIILMCKISDFYILLWDVSCAWQVSICVLNTTLVFFIFTEKNKSCKDIPKHCAQATCKCHKHFVGCFSCTAVTISRNEVENEPHSNTLPNSLSRIGCTLWTTSIPTRVRLTLSILAPLLLLPFNVWPSLPLVNHLRGNNKD